jgi:hypothetical protein
VTNVNYQEKIYISSAILFYANKNPNQMLILENSIDWYNITSGVEKMHRYEDWN